MKPLLLILLIFLPLTSIAGLNQNNWHPSRKHRCGITKFKCPKLANRCIRKPRAKNCEVVKVIKNKVRYQDYCRSQGLVCSGSYSSCEVPNSNGITQSFSYTVNPYLGCAP